MATRDGKPRPFLIWDWTRGRARVVSCVFRLKDPVTVGAVRAAVAQELGFDPRHIKLERCVGKKDGAELAIVGGGSGADCENPYLSCAPQFGDAGGRVWPREDVSQWWTELADDNAPFLLVRGRTNAVVADRL